jgi:hypothetical protein
VHQPLGHVSDSTRIGEDAVERGDGGFEEHVVDAGAELGVGPAGLLIPGELDTTPCAGAADVPREVM